ncbi:uncharacterized protein LOC141900609 isoform X2 [Tubulanus polymorphus]|uniref:uncharacterized protein LOC141900609 isoform X2 n=1 Tax=Tubulanus polymorphus TaxID=672921 RepID=UPI003DA22EA0
MEKAEDKDEAGNVPIETEETADSDGPLPEHMYSRGKLIDLSEVPASKTRPAELSIEFDTSDGYWDPEKWIRSFHVPHGDSPVTVPSREKRRPADLDRDFTRRAIDPKERIREERDGIILSPQRKSFGTGCHVTTSSQQRRPSSPMEYREPVERDRRNPDRRIGSGRLAMDRDRDRDFRSDRFNERRFERYRRDSRDSDEHDRDSRDTRRGQRSEYEDRRFSSRRPVRRREEEQPEWFTSGPTNQLETIELRGFEDPVYDEKTENGSDADVSATKASEKQARTGHGESVATNDSSSLDEARSTTPEKPSTPASSDKAELQQEQAPNGPDFDFNAFFNLETIPGLGSNPTVESEATVPQSGSRFTRWFQTNSPHNSRNGSRRSSFTDDYNYLHDLSFSDIVGGHRSPTIPSPSDPPGMFSPIPNIEDQQQQQQQSLFEMMMMNNKPNLHVPPPSHQTHMSRLSDRDKVTASAMEADLKALLFSGKKPEISQQQQRPVIRNRYRLDSIQESVPTDRIKTLAELEAGVSSTPMKPQQHTPQQQPSNEDMTAFNKLLGLMKASGSLPNSPQAPHKPVPVTIMTPQQQQARSDPSLHQPQQAPQKDMLQELLRTQQQRQIQEQQRQMQVQQRQMQEQQQRQLHEQHRQMQEQQQCQMQEQKQRQMQEQNQQQKQLQQIQAKLLQHQQQQEMLKNIIKNKPTIITKPASPVVNVPQQQQPTTPNVPSPNILLQQPSSPRAPSPIMFGTQPPMHLSAPSPIHPTQSTTASPTANLSVNTLQVTPGSPTSLRPSVLPRVPSPQELVFHTQAIMQNALIKKQLEDQKERFIKKQQQHEPNRKSPNPMRLPGEVPTTPVASTTQSVSAAFTPTSVIMKMASEKKMREESDIDMMNQQLLPQFQQQIRSLDDSNLSPPRLIMTKDQLPVSPQHIPGRPLVGQGVMNALVSQQGRPIMKATAANQPTVSAPQNSPLSVGNEMNVRAGGSGTAAAAVPSTPNERQNECPKSPNMNNLRTPPNMPHLPNTTTPPFLSPIAGRLPMQGTRPAIVNPAAANALLVQQMMQAGMTQQNAIVAAAARVNALQNQMNMNLNPLATIQQQQQRTIDPRMPVRGVYPNLVPGQRAGLLPNSPNALGVPNMNNRSLSPQPQIHSQFVADGRNGPLSPGVYPKAASPNMTDSNLTKWFGMDLLKQQLPNMPPLPAPGQRVMTVDEIERRQQVVT